MHCYKTQASALRMVKKMTFATFYIFAIGLAILASPSTSQAQTFSATGMITDWNGYTQTMREQ